MNKLWITGGTGFFGSHIAERLGARAIVTTRKEIDLLDKRKVEEFVRNGDFTQIVHAAGYVGGMQLMKSDPERMYEENFRMGQNVLEAAASKGGMHVALIGTALCYPEDAPVPTPESALFKGELQRDTAAYAQSKLDLLEFARERKIPHTYLIFTNMFGPRNHLEPERSNVIASLFLRAMRAKRQNEEALTVWGTGDETRDFLYVEDAARAVEMALDKKWGEEVLNLGSGRETSIAELARLICDIVDFRGKLVFDPSKGGGASRRCLDASRAEQELGFKATTSLEDGLQRTNIWIEQTLSQQDA